MARPHIQPGASGVEEQSLCGTPLAFMHYLRVLTTVTMLVPTPCESTWAHAGYRTEGCTEGAATETPYMLLLQRMWCRPVRLAIKMELVLSALAWDRCGRHLVPPTAPKGRGLVWHAPLDSCKATMHVDSCTTRERVHCYNRAPSAYVRGMSPCR